MILTCPGGIHHNFLIIQSHIGEVKMSAVVHNKPVLPLNGGIFSRAAVDGGYINASLPEQFFQLVIGVVDGLRYDTDVAHDRHEIGVSLPAGDNMTVDMVGDTRPGDPSHVYAQVEAVGIEGLFHNTKALLLHLGMLVQLYGGQFVPTGYMTVRCDQQVPGVVGVIVHHDEIVASVE